MELYRKIAAAKQGVPQTIYPGDLVGAEYDRMVPITLADIINVCEAFSLPYVYNVSPPTLSINNTNPIHEHYLNENENPH